MLSSSSHITSQAPAATLEGWRKEDEETGKQRNWKKVYLTYVTFFPAAGPAA